MDESTNTVDEMLELGSCRDPGLLDDWQYRETGKRGSPLQMRSIVHAALGITVVDDYYGMRMYLDRKHDRVPVRMTWGQRSLVRRILAYHENRERLHSLRRSFFLTKPRSE